MQIIPISYQDRLKTGLTLLITVASSIWLFSYVNANAPVLLYQDRWSSLEPLFNNESWWSGFTHQHGPHRLGLAYVFFNITAHLSDWNARWDMFLQAFIYGLCSLLAFRLKVLIFKKVDWTDALIPLIFISLQSALTVTLNPYVHGLVPLLTLALCLSYFARPALKHTLLALISFVALFTGFALFVTVIFVAIELVFLLKKGRVLQDFSYLLLPLLAFIYLAFTQKSNVMPHMENSISYYVKYATLLAGNFVFFNQSRFWPIILVGAIVFFGFFIFKYGKSLVLKDPLKVKILMLLIAPSLLFTAANLVSRSDIGMDNALTSRYIPITMPLYFGIYFMILLMKERAFKIGLLFLFAIAMIRFEVSYTIPRITRTTAICDRVKQWEDCLLENPSYKDCKDQLKRGLLYKTSKENPQAKIDYLRVNKLSIFKQEN